MTDPFRFRSASLADAGSISRLIQALAAGVTTDPTGRGAAPFLATLTPEAIAANLNSERFLCHLAWAGPDLAGVIGIRDASQPIAHNGVRAFPMEWRGPKR